MPFDAVPGSNASRLPGRRPDLGSRRNLAVVPILPVRSRLQGERGVEEMVGNRREVFVERLGNTLEEVVVVIGYRFQPTALS